MEKGEGKKMEGGAHILMIPYPGQGHFLPLVDLAHNLALRGLTITFVVTPKNLPILQPLLSLHSDDGSSSAGTIHPLVLPFPDHPSLPLGVENSQHLPLSFLPDIMAAVSGLFLPILLWIQDHPSPPVAIVADAFLCHWTLPLARRVGVPNLAFSVVNACTLAAWAHNYLAPITEAFNAIAASWRLIINSFPGLDAPWLRHVHDAFPDPGRVFSVGPLLPVKSSTVRGRLGPSSVPADEVIAWLDTQPDDRSVAFVGFGSQVTLTVPQMAAVATALEESAVAFVWAVKEPMKDQTDDYGAIPPGFEDRTAKKGLVIKGWAPQVAILSHRAVGSYLTHCGWNSALEGLLAGVLLLAWPMQADHHFNAEVLVDHLRVAVKVCDGIDAVPDSGELARAIAGSINGENRDERARLEELRTAAVEAVDVGGSSHKALDELANELCSLGLK